MNESGSAAGGRTPVLKTHKLFIGGKFPRSESGRTVEARRAGGGVYAHVSRASRKDLRDAVQAARDAFASWSAASAYLRGQILYRLAEMLEGRAADFERLLAELERADGAAAAPTEEVAASVDRLIVHAGWADKYAQMLGCANAVASGHHNFSIPGPTGVVAVVTPGEPALLGLASLIGPALCVGNTVVAVVCGNAARVVAAVFAEACATADLPAGALNILTAEEGELTGHLATHGEINAVLAAGVPEDAARELRAGAAVNLKRVTVLDGVDWMGAETEGVGLIEHLVEIKTIWHPSAM